MRRCTSRSRSTTRCSAARRFGRALQSGTRAHVEAVPGLEYLGRVPGVRRPGVPPRNRGRLARPIRMQGRARGAARPDRQDPAKGPEPGREQNVAEGTRRTWNVKRSGRWTKAAGWTESSRVPAEWLKRSEVRIAIGEAYGELSGSATRRASRVGARYRRARQQDDDQGRRAVLELRRARRREARRTEEGQGRDRPAPGDAASWSDIRAVQPARRRVQTSGQRVEERQGNARPRSEAPPTATARRTNMTSRPVRPALPGGELAGARRRARNAAGEADRS